MTDETTGGPHPHMVHWAAAGAIFAGTVVCGAAIITGLLIMGIVGAVVLVAGGITAVATGMLQNVEEYPSPRRNQ